MTSAQHQAADTRIIFQDAQSTAISLGKSVEGVLKDMGFNPQQIEDVIDGESKISGYTWYHHQETGRMQLISEAIHNTFRHNGGFSLWGN